ncbi:MAG: hypothetical protein IJB02_02620 [Oscillospiraceae bacterium]|nr:hypothetical protein [Oscillospiraceae bacterium]
MKKFLAVLFALALVAMLPLTAFAATGINENEKTVLAKLETAVDLGSKGEYKVPQSYINTAKNYFAGDCDMTEAEAAAIISCIEEGIAIIKDESAKVSGNKFDLKKLPTAAREDILDLGQQACDQVDLKLEYNPTSGKVVIKDGNTPVFNNAAVIKTTGHAVTVDATFVCVAVVVCLTLATGVMFVVSKRNGLLEK